jgi:hypothetical protein
MAFAAALAALAVAAPSAGAATFDGGSLTVDLKTLVNKLKAKVANSGADKSTKTGGTFELGTGTATLNSSPSGQFNVGSTSDSITLKVGKKKLTLSKVIQKYSAGKGQLFATVGGKSQAILDIQSQGKAKPDSGFTGLTQSSSATKLTKAGAAALNKAFGLKGNKALKAGFKVGTDSLTADRKLTIVGGSDKTIYDQAFYDKMASNDEGCSIILSHVAPATKIDAGAGAPRGGVDLPVIGGALNAKTLVGTVSHDGGTALDRGPGNPQGAEYHSRLTQFIFGFVAGATPTLEAFSSDLNGRLAIGTVANSSLQPTLTDTGGSVKLTGVLALSNDAGQALKALSDPDGAGGPKHGCDIPAGSNIGAIDGVLNVE